MKDNNKRMNNQGRNVTFVEDLGSIIRRNSTIPQAVSGELRITNGDVEGIVAVNCSNAAYRASVSESTLPRPYFTPNLEHVYVPSASCSSKDHEKMPAECNGCNIPADEKDCRACGYSDIDCNCPSASCSSKDHEKMPAEEKYDHSEYYKAKSFAEVSEIIKQELEAYQADPANDIVKNSIRALIELEIISDFTYELECRFAFIDGKAYEGELGSILRDVTNISEERAKAINNVISDAAGCDLIIRARKNGRPQYRVTAEPPKTGFVRCADNETMAQFINRITKE